MSKKDKHRFSIGLDSHAFIWLKAKAEAERRSLSAMTNELIRQAKEAETQVQATDKAA
jgi:hypothetical protein